jgi:hypothetical protein
VEIVELDQAPWPTSTRRPRASSAPPAPAPTAAARRNGDADAPNVQAETHALTGGEQETKTDG